MKISVSGSIVLYKTDSGIKHSIESFLNTSLPVKLYLVDNSPTDKLRTEFADVLADSRIEYIFNNKNIGFGAAHNIAIRRVYNFSQYHLVLNPDINFSPGVLENLFEYSERNYNAGLVMPKIIYPDGNIQYTCKLLPTPLDLVFRRFLPSGITRKRLHFFELRDTGYDKEMEVPYLSGCFMFLRTQALKDVGLFDERFFMYPEDIDMTRRIHSKYKTLYYPYVSVVHTHAKESYKSAKLLWIHIFNMIKYFNKWGWFFDKERKRINKRILSQFE